jgi:hypothetical protein
MDYLNLETFELLVKHNACILHYTVPKDWQNWMALKNIPWIIRIFLLIVLENMCTLISFKFCR